SSAKYLQLIRFALARRKTAEDFTVAAGWHRAAVGGSRGAPRAPRGPPRGGEGAGGGRGSRERRSTLGARSASRGCATARADRGLQHVLPRAAAEEHVKQGEKSTAGACGRHLKQGPAPARLQQPSGDLVASPVLYTRRWAIARAHPGFEEVGKRQSCPCEAVIDPHPPPGNRRPGAPADVGYAYRLAPVGSNVPTSTACRGPRKLILQRWSCINSRLGAPGAVPARAPTWAARGLPAGARSPGTPRGHPPRGARPGSPEVPASTPPWGTPKAPAKISTRRPLCPGSPRFRASPQTFSQPGSAAHGRRTCAE
ncbi:unnamed protein product, partial [Prorocentrum cordatum]